LSHTTLILLRVATALVGEGMLVQRVLEIGNRKGRCCSFAYVTFRPILAAGGGAAFLVTCGDVGAAVF